ncbi:MAG: hypothetical protein B1H13_08800 [Desulfobacteraceae bacterium 4484_190.3]|nr:MAG: hypothetical protein B1H13_08800 [Desulfobacteraceae bacterium 4484_190.3]
MKRLTLLAVFLLLCLHSVPGASTAANLPDIFGLEVGNTWLYQSVGDDRPFTVLDRVVHTMPHASTTLHVMERRENGVRIETQWLERKPGQVRLWGGTSDLGGTTYTMQFSEGLVQLWYPMHEGESKSTATILTIKELAGHVFKASMAVDVVGKKRVSFPSGVVTGYKIRYQTRVWGHGMDETATFIQWWVPYLGYVKYEDQQTVDKLVSFSIGGGNITQDADSGTLIAAIANPITAEYGKTNHGQGAGTMSMASQEDQ